MEVCMILAIETSAVICSVAFWEDGKILLEYTEKSPMQHATVLAGFVEKGLNKLEKAATNKDISAVAVSIGPGSYTGLRIGLSYAQGICYGGNIPIVGISNHQVLAVQAEQNSNEIFTIIDARRNEVYLARHQNNQTYEIVEHKIEKLSDLAGVLPANCTLVIHEDITLVNETIKLLNEKNIRLIPNVVYSAQFIADVADIKLKLNGSDNLEELEPLYIRPFAGVQ